MSLPTATRPGHHDRATDDPTPDTVTDTAIAGATTGPARSADTGTTWSQRTVEAITDRLSTKRMGRRSFLTKAALVGSALAVDPIGFIIKPGTAWASVCGEDNEFNEGWSAFCATINDGANTCPSGSYVAGWWKIDNTTFCSGRARYIVDCNRTPGSSCSCRSANGQCDRRRVCCNNFRYGQCNTQIKGTTQVVCRIVLCTPPWQWGNCTTTSLTSNQTRTHWSSRLPSRTNPTPIKVYWLEAGLTGSVLGDMIGSERSVSGGGSWATFDNGVLTATSGGTIRQLTGPHADAYARLDGPNGPLGFPTRSVSGNAEQASYANGSTWRNGGDAYGLWDGLDAGYRARGGPDGYFGPPVRDQSRSGPYQILYSESGWNLVTSETQSRAKVLRSVSNLPRDGSWPATVETVRWSGPDRYATAVEVSQQSYRSGADAILVVRGDDFPDATTAGAVSARLGAPILLTARDRLPDVVRDEIRRLGPSRAFVLGGTSAVSGAVVSTLRDLVDDVARWSGNNRVTTAIEVSRNVFPGGAPNVVLATGESFPDALTIAPEAHRRAAPVLLVTGSRIPDAVRTEIRRLDPGRILLTGGEAAISAASQQALRDEFGITVERLSGSNRYRTAARIARRLPQSSLDEMVFTTGQDFPDGLAASSWATPRQVPILLADNDIDRNVDIEVRSRRPRRIVVVGGGSAVSAERAEQLRGYLL